MKKSMYYKSVFYAFLMILFGVLSYLFLNNGFTTRTKVIVDYDNSSDVFYKVRYLDNKYNNLDNGKYVADMIDYIEINYVYNNIISEYVNGYYRYNVEGYLVAYEDDITDSLWEKKYQISDEKTYIFEENNVNSIKIEDGFILDFKKYRDEINNFINDYDIFVDGYLHIRINILEFFSFDSLSNEYADNKVITMNIPLTKDVFKIRVDNIDNTDSYYEFSNSKTVNIMFIIIGIFLSSLLITLFIMVYRQFIIIYNRQSDYKKELNKIFSKYDDCIIKVNKLYVNKKYNMICVDSFSELMDVYKKKNKMISFKEIKRGAESLFVIIDEEDAWIYRLKLD